MKQILITESPGFIDSYFERCFQINSWRMKSIFRRIYLRCKSCEYVKKVH